ncbi:MAG: arginine deiminase family protein [Flavobacteriaceae bacterium]|nr:arginine deiminase family protein [Flavobacteriaceae bacterium]
MSATHHSEYLKLASLFLKRAEAAFISDDLIGEQWQRLQYLERPDYKKAVAEYRLFEKIFTDLNIDIHYFPSDENVTIDSIYCRDASIATDFGMILCHMGKADRINEPGSQKQSFQQKEVPILGKITAPGTLEGGDVAWLDEKTLAVGHTYRTNEEGIRQLKALLEPKGIEVLVVALPHYKGPTDVFHLMSVLSPVDKDLAVVYSPLMPIKFRNDLLARGFELVEVPEEEFDSLGCNVLAVAPRKCLVAHGNPKTRAKLTDAGCEIQEYKGEHISVMGGGGPTCLTRPLLRMR